MISLWLLLNTTPLFLPQREGGPRKKTRVTRQRKVSATDATDVTSAPTEKQAESQASRYQLGQKRRPRYKSGTYGLRDCVCSISAVNENREVPIGARGVAPERRQNEYLVHRLVVRAEKTFAGVERTGNHSAEKILQQLAVPGFAKAPCLRNKEFRQDPLISCSARSISSESQCKWPGASLLACYLTDMG